MDFPPDHDYDSDLNNPPTPSPFLDLPYEIRHQIYSYLFTPTIAHLNVGNDQSCKTLLPSTKPPTTRTHSAQLLRTCSTILFEARPLLYASTTFHISTHIFAGRLPVSISPPDHSTAPHIQHVVYQLHSDFLMRTNFSDLRFQSDPDWSELQTLALWVRVDAWQDSWCGDGSERAKFAEGRAQLIRYAREIVESVNVNCEAARFTRVVEDCRVHGQVEVRLSLERKGRVLGERERLVDLDSADLAVVP